MSTTVSINDIEPNPFQSRKEVDAGAVERLAKQIGETGFWNTTLRVRRNNGHYELVFGHQRLEALKRLGRKQIDVDVIKLNDLQMAEQSLIENIQRTNLPEIDKAEAIRRLMDMEMSADHARSDIASKYETAIDRVRVLLGYKNASTISDFLGMTKLHPSTKIAIRTHNLNRDTVKTARAIGGSGGGERMIKAAATKGLNIDDLAAVRSELAQLPRESRAKVAEKIIVAAEAIDTSDPVKAREQRRELGVEAKRLTRQEQGKLASKERVHPDLMLFIEKWTGDLNALTNNFKAAGKFKAYIHEHPETVAKVKTAAERLITVLKDVLDL